MLLCRRLRNILTAHARPLSSKPTEFAPPKNENEDLNKNKGKDTLGRRLLSLIYPKRSAIVVLNKWTQEGKTIQKYQLNRVVRELRKYNRYKHALEKRWESLLNQGRRVIVVGDLNIAPAAIDRCDAEPGFEKNMYAETILSRKR